MVQIEDLGVLRFLQQSYEGEWVDIPVELLGEGIGHYYRGIREDRALEAANGKMSCGMALAIFCQGLSKLLT
jgi:hypothetical protein